MAGPPRGSGLRWRPHELVHDSEAYTALIPPLAALRDQNAGGCGVGWTPGRCALRSASSYRYNADRLAPVRLRPPSHLLPLLFPCSDVDGRPRVVGPPLGQIDHARRYRRLVAQLPPGAQDRETCDEWVLPSGEINESITRVHGSIVRQVIVTSDTSSPTTRLMHPPLTGITEKGVIR